MPTWELHITGRVQGVGFRPHVFRLAHEFELTGVVRNGNDGVRITFNAPEELATNFSERLLALPPPLAVITDHSLNSVGEQLFDKFEIKESFANGRPDLLMSPDFAICQECRGEVDRLSDRRYGYAFTTCTNCGPRYSISTALPYDRQRTEMSAFSMCESCSKEYHNPSNRRYFSQTNSCPDCGISLTLIDKHNARSEVVDINTVTKSLHEGSIVAVKGIAGFLLLADASNADTILKIRSVKHRDSKPLAVLYPSADAIVSTYFPGARIMAEIASIAAPIVLVNRTQAAASSMVTQLIAPGLDQIGVLLPNTPLLHLIANAFGKPLVATSANVSGEPILSDGQEAEVAELSDFVLTHNLQIAQPQDDSLVRFTEVQKNRIVLRRGRGLAPALLPLAAQPNGIDLLACGADLKGGFAIRSNNRIYLSPCLGDLSKIGTQQRYKSTLKLLSALTEAKPTCVLVDLHPSYFSTELGETLVEESGLDIVKIQHHEAHFAAVLGEHKLLKHADPILGVIWDGIGLGTDGNIWGGEFFRYEKQVIKRIDHLRYFPLIGGDKMATEPRYAALAWAGDDQRVHQKLEATFGKLAFKNLLLLRSRQNLLTSSVGRLFDAVAFLLGLAEVQSYEGMAATQLEQLARLAFRQNPSITPYSVSNLREELISDLGVRPSEEIAGKFHCTLVEWVRQTAETQKINHLAFSGGVFQNSLLVDLLFQRLPTFKLYFHEQLPPNDENLGYGQLIHYSLQSRRAQDTSKTTKHVLSNSR